MTNLLQHYGAPGYDASARRKSEATQQFQQTGLAD